MKFILFTTFVVLINVISLFSQPKHIETILSVVDKDNKGVQLYFGLDIEATDGRDPAMGESEKPGHPPNGMHALLMLPTEEHEYCYRDFRKLSNESQQIYKEFRIEVQPASARNFDPIYFRWEYPLQSGIDSIVIYDRKTNGQTAKFNLDSKKVNIVSNENADSFIAKAYYHPKTTGVEEDVISNVIFPNPASNFIVIHGLQNIEQIEITDIYGKTYHASKFSDSTLSISDLHSGVYALSVVDATQKRMIGTFVKQ